MALRADAELATPPTRRERRGTCGYCTISELRSGALPPRAVRTVETPSVTFDQSSPVRLRDLGAAHQFERRLAVLGAGIEPRVVERRPARIAHRIGDPQRRLGRGGGGEIDPDLELARRLGCSVLLEPRDLAVDVTLLALGVADRGIGGGDFLGDRGKGRAPFGDRTRLALLAEPAGEASAKRSANLRRALAAAIAPCRSARSSFSASMRLSSSGRLTGGAARGGRASMAPMVSFAPASPSTRSEDGSSDSGKSFATSVLSPDGRSSVMTRVTLAPSG